MSAKSQFTAPERFDFTARDGEPYLQYTAFNSSPVHRNRLAGIIHMIGRCGPSSSPRILEIGCGVGNIALPIASLGYPIRAIDVHGPSVEAARRRNTFPNLKLDHVPLDQVDLGEYDVIVLTEVLEHVEKHEEMMALLGRGMRPGARLILTIPNGWGQAELMCRPAYLLKRSRIGGAIVNAVKRLLATRDLTTANEQTPHVHFFTLGALARLFAQSGFETKLFYRYFVTWLTWETFFSERGLPEEWARRDFERSQNTAPSLCALWAFLLEKK